ncbi:hypothetical protein MHYP_G00304710 [Metynnis hypsauchen]
MHLTEARPSTISANPPRSRPSGRTQESAYFSSSTLAVLQHQAFQRCIKILFSWLVGGYPSPFAAAAGFLFLSRPKQIVEERGVPENIKSEFRTHANSYQRDHSNKAVPHAVAVDAFTAAALRSRSE